MTRVLSELLGTIEPVFRQGIQQLESASGHNSADIRLSTDLAQATKRKLKELGLDQQDTTGQELYAALETRFAADDKRLFEHLREKYAEAEDIDCVVRELNEVPIPKTSFALKATVVKALIKKNPPKKAMKQLGYRSIDSLLKHEPAAQLLAAGWLLESATWRKQYTDGYKKVKASDFEIRPMHVVHPATKKWQQLANTVVAQRRHNVVSFKELGTVVLLPLPEERPPAAAMTSLLLALQAMNEIRAASTFLKLCQVRPDFGGTLYSVVVDEPSLATRLFDRPVSWEIIQRYYGRFLNKVRGEVFEPHVQAEDLTWHSIEKVLNYIDPTLDFWRHTTHLSLLQDHKPVSLNIIDVAINYCNGLPYEHRVVSYFQQSLWHELIIRYLKHDEVERTVLSGLESTVTPQAEFA